MNTKPKLILTAISLAILSVAIAFTSRILLAPPTIQGSHDILEGSQLINLTGAFGPESLAFDITGEGPYVGVSDGRILKWQGTQKGWLEFAVTSSQRDQCVRPFAPELEHICGRPLGLRFDKRTGDLYIADAYLGLQVVGQAGGLATLLVNKVEGVELRFTNDLDIDEHEDVIYFSDTSTTYYRREFVPAILSLDKTGRLLKYDKSSKEITVLLKDISFANGVALSRDGSFVLVAETTLCRIIRFWLRGPNAGKHDIFTDLPGNPDNIRRNSKGEFWVALHAKKGLLAEMALSHPWLGRTLLKLPFSYKQIHYLLIGLKPHATAVKLSEKGEILEVLEDTNGKTVMLISEVEEKNGKLWIGSVLTPFIGVYNLKESQST
ncbi:hypothetical protein LIER_26002 [Lithospermum erythrorhizon]|uniref:Strictosidine synthase conserved region domain-containing protein n=1 Tax=Lithospermum erythrorhizon TaxID=34254 RepID=A0AAV3RCP4_LITER